MKKLIKVAVQIFYRSVLKSTFVIRSRWNLKHFCQNANFPKQFQFSIQLEYSKSKANGLDQFS